MTANLLVDGAAPAALSTVIEEYRPDVVAVQELGPRSAATIGALMAHGHLDPRSDGFGLGIAARRPVRVQRLDLVERPGWMATLEPGTWGIPRPFTVVDAHLTNPVDFPWHLARKRRRAQVSGITEAVGQLGHPYAIVGDMNTTPAWPEYRQLAALGVDAARATGTARRTWNHVLWGPRLLRIDHGFVSGATPVTTRTVVIDGSDHRALIIDVEL